MSGSRCVVMNRPCVQVGSCSTRVRAIALKCGHCRAEALHRELPEPAVRVAPH